ncbi:HAD family hydrolase [Schlesneria paludicola]|uniref:HAD family hydrolase n=1 Tax=Schlesneria paludicola TaxID=360056 RepID=UPI000299DA68|nr:HAD family hydrolase [Schlesneria paludicola]
MIVFFDIDDTLIDHSRAMQFAVRQIHQQYQLSSQRNQFEEAWRLAHFRHYPRYLRGEITYDALRRIRVRETVAPDLDDQQADALFETYLLAYRANWMLFDDVSFCLQQLSSRHLGIISNGPADEQRNKLHDMKIAPHFSMILISADCRIPKPRREIFQIACQKARVRVEDAIYVGDHPEIDAVASQKAGLRAIWLNRSNRDSHPQSIETIHSLRELPRLVS